MRLIQRRTKLKDNSISQARNDQQHNDTDQNSFYKPVGHKSLLLVFIGIMPSLKPTAAEANRITHFQTNEIKQKVQDRAKDHAKAHHSKRKTHAECIAMANRLIQKNLREIHKSLHLHTSHHSSWFKAHEGRCNPDVSALSQKFNI